jgi:hypothetical protein
MTEFPDIPGGQIAYGTCGTGPLVPLAHGLVPAAAGTTAKVPRNSAIGKVSGG